MKKYKIKIRNRSEKKQGEKPSVYIDGRTLKKNHCIDCNKEIQWRSKRCLSCAMKERLKKLKTHPRFKDGRCSKIYYCIDCLKKGIKTEISYGAERCPKCAGLKCSIAKKLKYNDPRNHPRFIDGRRKAKHYCIVDGCNNEISYRIALYGSGLCHSCAMKKKWKNKEYREKVIKNTLKASHVKINKKEAILNRLLQTLLPNEYKINIKGEVMILGRKIPDFVNVNGQKKVIEMYGDYWHSDKFIKKHGCYEDTEEGRIKYFKKLGWKTLIIWEHELKDLEKVKQKILEFNKGVL